MKIFLLLVLTSLISSSVENFDIKKRRREKIKSIILNYRNREKNQIQGKFSVISNQYDKTIEMFKGLIKSSKTNTLLSLTIASQKRDNLVLGVDLFFTELNMFKL